MANVAFDPNSEDQQSSTTDVFAPQQTQSTDTSSQPVSDTGSYSYVSDGNPYGSYAQPSITMGPSNTQSSSSSATRKQNNSASSGSFTNSQTYADKNKSSIDKMNQAVSKGIQNTANMIKQNTENLNKQFQHQVEAGSLENYDTAVDRSRQAFQEAAQVKAPTKEFINSEATRYIPQQNEQGLYSDEDQSLIDSNMARVIFGDGTTKDFATESEAQTAIDDWNRQNKGVYSYGDEQQLSLTDKELSDILNAKYEGPTDLYQTQGYGDVYNQVNEAQALLDLAQSGDFKGTLLKDLFGSPNSEYNLGAQRLDDLLFGQGESGDLLRAELKALGNFQDQFSANNQAMRQVALDRDALMNQIRKDSRSALDEIALGRESEINQRLNQIIADWEKYPDYYRQLFQNELDRHDNAINAQNQYNKLISSKETAKANLDKLMNQYGRAQSIYDLYGENAVKEAVNAIRDKQLGSAYSALGGPAPLQKSKKYYDKIAQAIGFNNFNQFIRSNVANELSRFYFNGKNEIEKARNDYNQQEQALNDLYATSGLDESYLKTFDPNAFNLGLSQLEAAMLGIKGGEGIYDLLKQGGIDALIRTAAYDENRLISEDEQHQLARLQQIAELANDYGSQNSGINYRNQFTDRDAAGTQSALDALDMDYFRDQLQGREKQFRDETANKIITGVGTGKGSSGGALGKSTKKVTTYLDQNIGDLIKQAGGYRNMYDDTGLDNETLDQILQLAKTTGRDDGTFTTGQNSAIEQIGDFVGDINPIEDNPVSQLLTSIIGNTGSSIPQDLLNSIAQGITFDYGGAIKSLSSALTGNSSKAKSKAAKKAYEAAARDLQNKVNDYMNQQGVGNQFMVNQDEARDLELLKLLGLLDTTNR